MAQRNARFQRRQRTATSNSVIVIDDSDDDAPGDGEDLDRKPAAKPSAATNPPCISLLDSSDEENHRGVSPNNRKKRKTCSLSRREAADRELAERLQRQENLATRKASARLAKERREMIKSSDGKAVLAVQEIVALVKEAKETYLNKPPLRQFSVEAVTIDDMVFFAKNMLDLQQEFIQKQIPGHIDVGYHYTDQRNMADIRSHGLLTKSDRQTQQVQAIPKGSRFGDGIYTANNGTCFSKYGDTGLIVGRLMGKMVCVAWSLPPNQIVDANTIIGDKLTGVTQLGRKVESSGWPSDSAFHEIVLRSSAQCLPMIKFDKALRGNHEGKKCVRYLKKQVREILNRLFNKGLQRCDFRNVPLITGTPLPTTRAPNPSLGLPPNPPSFNPPSFLPAAAGAWTASVLAHLQGAPALNQALFAPAPPPPNPLSYGTAAAVPSWRPRTAPASRVVAVTASTPRSLTLNYTAPRNLTTGIPLSAHSTRVVSCNMREICVICHDCLKEKRCVALNACKHVFHSNCIRSAFKSKPQCPICRVSIGKPQGKSPSGTMSVSLSPHRCSGFQENSTVISYNILPGRQLAYHDNPGKYHGGKYVVAYLPNTKEGQDLLKRLTFAWMHGLTFTVGTSMTTGRANQCTWASIHHKTSPSGGTRVHGFPDPDYFQNCNGELDGAGVPPATELDNIGAANK